MTKRAPPAGRKRTMRVWLIIDTDDLPLGQPFYRKADAADWRHSIRAGELPIIAASLTWEPPKRRPR